MSAVAFLGPEHIASFLTLVFLEIVLAGDNLVLIAILSGRLPESQRPAARQFGLLAAVGTRLLLLLSLYWLSRLQTPIPLDRFGLKDMVTTPRQIVLGLGGLFLLLKSLSEIATFFAERRRPVAHATAGRAGSSILFFTILQIALFDIVFSLDSVIAAIGIARHVEVMAAAIITAALIMFFLVNPISSFIDRFPTLRLIALNFLALVGIILGAEALQVEIEHTWYYLGLACVIVVQIAGLWFMARSRAVRLLLAALVLAATAAFGVGAWHHAHGVPSAFNDAYVAAAQSLEAARSAIETMLATMRPWFGMNWH